MGVEHKHIGVFSHKVAFFIPKENTQLKSEVDQLKNKNIEHEQKQIQSKNVLQAARKKLSSQNEEINKLNTENTELKQKLSSSEQPTGGRWKVKGKGLKEITCILA